MTQLLERERTTRVVERPVAPPKPLWPRLLMWFSILVAIVAVGFAIANLFIGDEVVTFDREAEHGDHTALVMDLRTEADLATKFVGLDANLDPDVPFEHGPFTAYVPDLRTPQQLTPSFVGLDANLDPDVVAASPEGVSGVTPSGDTVPAAEGSTLADSVRSPPEAHPADRKFFETAPIAQVNPADRKFIEN